MWLRGLREWILFHVTGALTVLPSTVAFVLLLSYAIAIATSLLGYLIWLISARDAAGTNAEG